MKIIHLTLLLYIASIGIPSRAISLNNCNRTITNAEMDLKDLGFCENYIELQPYSGSIKLHSPVLIIDSIEVYDLRGRLVIRKNIYDAQSVISVANIKPGNYFVYIHSNGKRIVKRLIKK